MTLYATNGTFSRGSVPDTNGSIFEVNLAGMRTIANNRHILADSGDHTLVGDGNANQRDAMIYDLIYNGRVNLDGTSQRFANTFTRFELGMGGDVLDLSVDPDHQAAYGLPDYVANVTAVGSEGEDWIWSGDGDDQLYGDELNSGLISIDINLFGAGFGDLIEGGGGSDTIHGDFGSLSLVGVTVSAFTLGDDVLVGDYGGDTIYGDYATSSLIDVSVSLFAFGHDDIDGGDGNDVIYGDAAAVGTISLAPNALRLGEDWILGGEGDDQIYGDPGAAGQVIQLGVTLLNFVSDQIHGENGDDIIVGDSAGDLLSAATGGDDLLFGDAGNDTITGDYTGALSSLVATLNFGDDEIEGGAGADMLVGDYRSGLGLTAANLLTFGDDTLLGGEGNDTIYGDTSNLAILGLGAGQDRVVGGGGDDDMWGDFPGLLTLVGGADTFVIGQSDGADTIHDFRLASDRIVFDGVAGAGSWSEVQGLISYSGGSAVIDLGGGNQVELTGITGLLFDVLGAGNFEFL